jgi:alpha-L-rhamnosidase
VEQEWPYVKRLVDYLLSFDPEQLASHCLGDHGSPGTAESFKTGTPDKEFVGWCTIARFARAAVRFTEILGEDGQNYQAVFDELKDRIRARFANDDGTFGDGTQTGLAFAADLGLADGQRLSDLLAQRIRQEDNVLSCGIFGATIAYDVLHRFGHSDVVESWLTREGTPSYRMMLASGSKALAEQFTPFLSSYNHAMFSSCLQWMYQALGGIRVADDAVGADKIELRPYFSKLTDHVTYSFATRHGEVSVRWTRDGEGKTHVSYSAPLGVTVCVME